jgi:hypothetical protein
VKRNEPGYEAARKSVWRRKRRRGAVPIRAWVNIDFLNKAQKSGLLTGIDPADIARAVTSVLSTWAAAKD